MIKKGTPEMQNGYGTVEQQKIVPGDVVLISAPPKGRSSDSTFDTSWGDPTAEGNVYVAEITTLNEGEIPDGIRREPRIGYLVLASTGNKSEESGRSIPVGTTSWADNNFGGFALLRRGNQISPVDGDTIYNKTSRDGILPVLVTERRKDNASHFTIQVEQQSGIQAPPTQGQLPPGR